MKPGKYIHINMHLIIQLMIHFKYDPGYNISPAFRGNVTPAYPAVSRAYLVIPVSCNLPQIVCQCSLHVLTAVGLLFEDAEWW